jgi:hypothetical protein
MPPARITKAAMSKRLGSSTRRKVAPIAIVARSLGLRQSKAGAEPQYKWEKTGCWMAAHSFIAKARRICNRR